MLRAIHTNKLERMYVKNKWGNWDKVYKELENRCQGEASSKYS